MSDHQPPVEKAELNQDMSATAESMVAPGTDVEALKAEVTKWQERVPKLAGALRERTDELAQARDEIRELKKQSTEGSGSDVARRARETLIEELEEKVTELRSKVQSLGGELHAATLACSEAQDEAQSWKSKWQEVTGSLDDVSAEQAEKDRAAQNAHASYEHDRAEWQTKQKEFEAEIKGLERAADELTALKRRNEQLVETTEMANVQIVALGEELSALVQRAESAEAGFAESKETNSTLQLELDGAKSEAAETKAQLSETAERAKQREASQEQKFLEAREAHRSELSNLTTSHREERSALIQQHADELTKLRTGLDRKLDETESQYEQKLQARTETIAVRDGEIAELKSAISAIEAETEQNKVTQRAELARLESDATMALGDKDRAETEVKRLEGCLNDALNNQERLQNERELQSQRVVALEEEVAQAEINLEQKSLAEQALQDKLRKVESTLTERTQLIQNLEDERNEQMRDGTHLAKNVEHLETELEAATQRAETLKSHAENTGRAR